MYVCFPLTRPLNTQLTVSCMKSSFIHIFICYCRNVIILSTDDQFYFFKGNQLEYLPLWKPYGSCVLTNRDIKYINNTKIHDPNGRLHYKKLHINRGFKQFYFPSVTRKQLSRFKGGVGSFSTFSWSSTNPTKRQKPTMMLLWFVVVSLEHQMCVNPPLKIVPEKSTFSSCLTNFC